MCINPIYTLEFIHYHTHWLICFLWYLYVVNKGGIERQGKVRLSQVYQTTGSYVQKMEAGLDPDWRVKVGKQGLEEVERM